MQANWQSQELRETIEKTWEHKHCKVIGWMRLTNKCCNGFSSMESSCSNTNDTSDGKEWTNNNTKVSCECTHEDAIDNSWNLSSNTFVNWGHEKWLWKIYKPQSQQWKEAYIVLEASWVGCFSFFLTHWNTHKNETKRLFQVLEEKRFSKNDRNDSDDETMKVLSHQHEKACTPKEIWNTIVYDSQCYLMMTNNHKQNRLSRQSKGES